MIFDAIFRAVLLTIFVIACGAIMGAKQKSDKKLASIITAVSGGILLAIYFFE